MRVLDLFSGIGGFSLGLERAGMETVAFCEVDPFCRQILNKHWPDVPIHNDIRELNGKEYQGRIDLICGGFPCQPFSTAGKRKGKDDDRDLWPEMFRIIREVRPAWVIGENVAGFINMEFERTANDLEAEGYQVQAFNIPACAVGAPHERKRIWIVAHSERAERWPGESTGDDGDWGFAEREEAASGVGTSDPDGRKEAMAYATSLNDRGRPGEICETNGRPQPGLRAEFGGPGQTPTSMGDPEYYGSFTAEVSGSVITASNYDPERKDAASKSSGTSKSGNYEVMADSDQLNRRRGEKESGTGKENGSEISDSSWWELEPNVGRMVDGLSTFMDCIGGIPIESAPQITNSKRISAGRLHRLKALGNSVVPQIPEILGRMILATEGIA